MADNTTGTTNTVLIVDDGHRPDFHGILRALELSEAKVFSAIALPPELMRATEQCLPSADKIMADIAAATPKLFGLNVMVSKLLSEFPVRVHKKRKWMSLAYHRRIQKKWNKRFGVGPVALLMNTNDVFSSPSTASPK